MMENLDLALINSTVMFGLSVLAELIPGFQKWWDKNFTSPQKQFIVAIVVLATSLGVLAWQCSVDNVCVTDLPNTLKALVFTIIGGFGGGVVGHGSADKFNKGYRTKAE
jgi:hypothetical protein